MVRIKNIRIKNFRSIVNLDIDVDNMSIFVGLNDAGKSNVLKALNLFFNGETEPGRKYNFDTDYSLLAPIREKKAQEITIAITFEIPSNYKDNDDVTWKKTWRKGDEPHSNSMDEMNFSAYSKVPILLKRIRYRYVPAVKSDDYFKLLLADLYLSIAKETNQELVSKSKSYSSALTNFTKQIGETVQKNIGISSSLRMPTNQIDIFKQLVFETSDDSKRPVELAFRGDGIKAMHIPAILNFIANQDNRALGANTVPITTIWGYEEPENGIEMKKCFELADELYGFSNNIQQFITTHSPGIYQLKDKDFVRVFYAYKDERHTTQISDEDSIDRINNEIGIMPLVTPLISSIRCENDRLKSLIENSALTDIDTIFVEGVSDKYYIKRAVFGLSPKLKSRIDNNTLCIRTRTENGCGTAVLCDWAKAWVYSGNRSKAVFLFDNDKAGQTAYREVKSFISGLKKSTCITAMKLEPTDRIKGLNSILRCGIPFEIEHLLSPSLWETMKKRGFARERSSDELNGVFRSKIDLNTTINGLIKKYIDDPYMETIIRYEPDRKGELVFAVKEMVQSGEPYIFEEFRNTIIKLEENLA